MSLSFSVTSKTLTNVGIGLGEIAVITGAGRNVVSWLTARLKDRALLDFLVKDEKEIIPRKGLVSTAELEQRWNRQLTLFQDGRILPFVGTTARNILHRETLDLFTWFMTLLTATLSAATSPDCARSVLLKFLSRRCLENDGSEHLVHDIGQHIQGWASIATTRNILRAARDSWERLGRQGIHPPGFMPDFDEEELIHMIEWLVDTEKKAELNRLFVTASSDVYSIAIVLNELGIGVLQYATALREDPLQYVLESQLLIVLDQSRLSSRPVSAVLKRKGMRINVTSPHECVSLWPGTETSNNRRRSIFQAAARASDSMQFSAGQLVTGDLAGQGDFQPLFVWKYRTVKRMPDHIYMFCEEFLIGATAETVGAVTGLFASWRLPNNTLQKKLDAIVRLNVGDLEASMISDIQVFILGYYYGLLAPIVDTSRMAFPEAFGSWTWDDLEICSLVRSRKKLSGVGKTDPLEPGCTLEFVERHFVLRMVAFLYAGAEMCQITTIRRGCCGVHGNVSVLDSTLMGDTDSVPDICRFVLLDVDKTFFPSNEQGLINPGERSFGPFQFISELNLVPINGFREISQQPRTQADFSSLVEPYWGVDPSRVVVAFRRHGRIVARLGPEDLYNGVFGASTLSSLYYGNEGQYRYAVSAWGPRAAVSSETGGGTIASPAKPAEIGAAAGDPAGVTAKSDEGPHVHVVELSELDGGRRVVHAIGIGIDHPPLYFKTGGLPRTRACVTGLYHEELLDTLHLANMRPRLVGLSETALVVNLDSGQVIVE